MHHFTRKRVFFLLISLSLLMGCLAPNLSYMSAQQDSDSNFDASVDHPAYASASAAPNVLFDEAHQNFHTTQGRYKPFVDLISNDGYRVVPNRQIFQSKSLANYAVLIISNATSRQAGKSAFSEAECDVVQNWVRSGGSLLLIADHKPYGSGAKNLAARFGVEMHNTFTVDLSHFDRRSGVPSFLLFKRENGLLTDHPITQGRNPQERLNQVMTFTGQSLSVPANGQALLRLSNSAIDLKERPQSLAMVRTNQGISAATRAQGVALSFGQGRVVILGEAAMISAQRVQSSEGASLIGMNYSGLDNRQFALNLMHWLSRLLS